jgi:galactofuranosylgalactofuranosylrhamnosyl-N-acetylglucosaminyl-diphospho-decaprenol beta-1,5/1,6-galactofuranosyltransferase
LYLRGFDAQPDVATTPDGALHLEAGQGLSTDTFFGSFYRGYWITHAGLSAVALSVELVGSVQLRLMEDDGQGVHCRLDIMLTEPTPRRFELVPEGLATTATSRLFVELRAEAASVVTALDVLGDVTPQREVSLSIGLCTFNQEAMFAPTLAKLVALAETTPWIRRIHVVNQGAPFADPAITALLDHPKVNPIQQRNLGGCGGFTRGMVEEMATADPASHQLLMDDDIVLDARMIERAVTFLTYAKTDAALGAGMLDALRPGVMYEAGAFLTPQNTIQPYCNNVDLTDPGQLWRFNAAVATDYNAWWFCILPLAVVRRIGLPAPIFIRGDDFEFGQRMARNGVSTVTLPGIGVWHDPFYAKPSSWQDYYDLRNRLIFGATYSDRVRQLSLAHVVGLVTTAVLTHNYASARLRLQAIDDFLHGPKALFAEDAAAIQARVLALSRPDAPERLGPEWAARPLADALPRRPLKMAELMAQQALAMLMTGLWPFARAEVLVMDVDARPVKVAARPYVVTNGPRTYHIRFQPKRGTMWQLMARAARMALRFRRTAPEIGRLWAGEIPAYRQPEWWDKTLAAPQTDR